MSHSRLTLAIEDHGLSVPAEGRIAVFAPPAGYDLGALPHGRVDVIQHMKPDHDAFARAGYHTRLTEDGPYALAVVVLPRAKAQARELVARAGAVADIVVVDGQKTDGIDSLLKACKPLGEIGLTLSKAHGRLFTVSGDFSAWLPHGDTTLDGGFVTRPGVFSADGIDPASAALAAALPSKLGPVVADLGAGWGFLSRAVLERERVKAVHLVDSDHVALTCARANIRDPRATFHWEDATAWAPQFKADTVVMNPPFHTGRRAEPALGVAFIDTAARILTPGGHLWMVANRHLPYEAALQDRFAKVDEVAGDNRFKVLCAARPARAKRAKRVT